MGGGKEGRREGERVPGSHSLMQKRVMSVPTLFDQNVEDVDARCHCAPLGLGDEIAAECAYHPEVLGAETSRDAFEHLVELELHLIFNYGVAQIHGLRRGRGGHTLRQSHGPAVFLSRRKWAWIGSDRAKNTALAWHAQKWVWASNGDCFTYRAGHTPTNSVYFPVFIRL